MTAQAPSLLNIVAHQDDDLLFMNPEISSCLRSGGRSTTVYITAGEAHFPPAADEPAAPLSRCGCKSPDQPLSRERYAACRRQGILAAYATLLGSNDDADLSIGWQYGNLGVGGGRLADLYVSKLNDKVALVFLNLPENADAEVTGGAEALRRLWQSPRAEVETIAFPDPLSGPRIHHYDRESLLVALSAVIDYAQPSVLRVQDPSPDPQLLPSRQFNDHTDHAMAGLFAARANELSLQANPDRRQICVTHRGYNISESPATLDLDRVTLKPAAFWSYAAYDAEVFPSNHHEYFGWLDRTYQRWPLGTTWAAADESGHVCAFAVIGNQLWLWSEQPDGRWLSRRLGTMAGRVLLPGVSVARTGDDTLTVFALSSALREGQFDLDLTVVSATLTGVVAEARPQWRDHGSPSPHSDIGRPVPVVLPGDRTRVVLRNSTGGLSWIDVGSAEGSWRSVDSLDIQFDPSVVPGTADGSSTVVAATTGGLISWTIDSADAPRPVSAQPAAGTPTAISTDDGEIAIISQSALGIMFHTRVDGSGNGWRDTVVQGEDAGLGSVASAPLRRGTTDGALLVFRDADSHLRATWHPDGKTAETTGAGGVVLGSAVIGDAAIVRIGSDRLVILALGLHAELQISELSPDHHGLDFIHHRAIGD